MREFLLLLGSAGSVLTGFSLLALAMDDHWQDVIGVEGRDDTPRMHPAAAVVLRIIGAGALMFSLAFALARNGGGFGTVLWVLLMSIGALCVVSILTWCPRLLRPVAKLARGKLAG